MVVDEVAKELEALVAAAAAAEETGGGEEAVAQAAATEAEGEAVGEEAAAPAPGTPGVQRTDYTKTGYHLDATVLPDQVVAAAEICDRHRFFIEAVTGVDWLKDGQMEVVYDYKHASELCRVVVRCRVDRDDPRLPTISGVYPGANWHERETHDFFGIVFTGHPQLEPLLLPEDADFHPLRKDYQP